jgi:Ca2+-binding EF-hand superfamily protein
MMRKKITFLGFIIGLHITTAGNLEEKLYLTFALYDTDVDHFISHNQMIQIVQGNS